VKGPMCVRTSDCSMARTFFTTERETEADIGI